LRGGVIFGVCPSELELLREIGWAGFWRKMGMLTGWIYCCGLVAEQPSFPEFKLSSTAV
jgi:hypothetical protein